MSKHSFTKKVGHCSNKLDLVDDFKIALRISSPETVSKKSNLGGSEGAGSVKESVQVNESLILVIFSKKKVTKRLVRYS